MKQVNFELLHNEVYTNLLQFEQERIHDEDILMLYRDEASNIEDLLSRTLTLGESNSLLIIGPRGCGKSLVINAILRKLESSKVLQLGLVVKLTGLLQTNDRLALREIMRQLNIDGEMTCKFGSFSENLNFILKTLQGGSRESSKPIIFILDEFDLFCHHRNQTLLYNLFDIAQSAQAPICVLGVTCRLDVIELLEKRVKSRFSHRQTFIFPQENIDRYIETAKKLLKLDKLKNKEEMLRWNQHVDKIFSVPEVKNVFKRRYCLSRDIRSLKMFLIFVVGKLNSENPWLSLKNFEEVISTFNEDSKKKILESVSILQLSLLISMKHLHDTYDGEPFNFEMVFKQYNKFGEKHSSMSSYERAVVFKAFDELEGLELIRPVEQTRTTLQREYRLMQLLVAPEQIYEVIQNIPNLPTFLKYWCSSNVL